MKSKTFVGIFKNIERAVNKSKRQAVNRALTSTRAKFASEVAKELGTPVKTIKNRSKTFIKGNEGVLSIGVKYDLPAQDFKPGEVKVNTSKGARYAATYKLKGNKQTLTDGSFVIKSNQSGKKLVMHREGEQQYPLKTTRLNVLVETVTNKVNELKEHLSKEYIKNFKEKLSFNLSDDKEK